MQALQRRLDVGGVRGMGVGRELPQQLHGVAEMLGGGFLQRRAARPAAAIERAATLRPGAAVHHRTALGRQRLDHVPPRHRSAVCSATTIGQQSGRQEDGSRFEVIGPDTKMAPANAFGQSTIGQSVLEI